MRSCAFFSGSTHLKCAVNPAEPCLTCDHYERREGFVESSTLAIRSPVPRDRRSSRIIYPIEVIGFGVIHGQILDLELMRVPDGFPATVCRDWQSLPRFELPPTSIVPCFRLLMSKDNPAFHAHFYRPQGMPPVYFDCCWQTDSHHVSVFDCGLQMGRETVSEIQYYVRGLCFEAREIADWYCAAIAVIARLPVFVFRYAHPTTCGGKGGRLCHNQEKLPWPINSGWGSFFF